MSCWRLVVAAGFVSLGLGCSGQTLHPVEGQVTVDGSTLDAGTIMLFPDSAKGNARTGQSSGKVAGGKFTVSTEGKPGAPPGWYKVTVIPEEILDSTKPLEVKSKVAARFREAAKTPLSFEVTANPAAGAYDLKVFAK